MRKKRIFKTEDTPTDVEEKLRISKRLDDDKLRIWLNKMKEKRSK